MVFDSTAPVFEWPHRSSVLHRYLADLEQEAARRLELLDYEVKHLLHEDVVFMTAPALSGIVEQVCGFYNNHEDVEKQLLHHESVMAEQVSHYLNHSQEEDLIAMLMEAISPSTHPPNQPPNNLPGTPTEAMLVGMSAGLNDRDLRYLLADGQTDATYERGFSVGDLVRVATNLDGLDRRVVAQRLHHIIDEWVAFQEAAEEEDTNNHDDAT